MSAIDNFDDIIIIVENILIKHFLIFAETAGNQELHQRFIDSCPKTAHERSTQWRNASAALQNLHGLYTSRVFPRRAGSAGNIHLVLAHCVNKARIRFEHSHE